jgi:hypothetical protein
VYVYLVVRSARFALQQDARSVIQDFICVEILASNVLITVVPVTGLRALSAIPDTSHLRKDVRFVLNSVMNVLLRHALSVNLVTLLMRMGNVWNA